MVLEILLIILIVAATSLCFYLIFAMRKIISKLDEMHNEVRQLIDSTLPVLDNLNKVANRANKIVSEAENYWEEIDNAIRSVKDRISRLTSLTRFRDSENPASDLIKNLKALFKGITTFWNEFKNK